MKRITSVLIAAFVVIILFSACKNENIMTNYYTDNSSTTQILWDGYQAEIPEDWSSSIQLENEKIILSLPDSDNPPVEIAIYNLGYTNDYDLSLDRSQQVVFDNFTKKINKQVDNIKIINAKYDNSNNKTFNSIEYTYTGEIENEKVKGECLIFHKGKFAINCLYEANINLSYFNDLFKIANSIKEIEYGNKNEYSTKKLTQIEVMNKYLIEIPEDWKITDSQEGGFMVESTPDDFPFTFCTGLNLSGLDATKTNVLRNTAVQIKIEEYYRNLFSAWDNSSNYTLLTNKVITFNNETIHLIEFEGKLDNIRALGKAKTFLRGSELISLFSLTPAANNDNYWNDFDKLIDSFQEKTPNETSSMVIDDSASNSSQSLSMSEKIKISFTKDIIDEKKQIVKITLKNNSDKAYKGNVYLAFYDKAKTKFLGSDTIIVDELLPGNQVYANIKIEPYSGEIIFEVDYKNTVFMDIIDNSNKTKDSDLTEKVKDDFYWNFYDTNWYNQISDIVVYTDKTCDVILTNGKEAYTRAFSVYEIASEYGVRQVYAKDTSGNVLSVKK